MIAHIAQADEHRGRVVLWLGACGDIQDTAVDAALRLAQAFDSEIESLFIADRQLFDLAALPFSREISFSGRRSRTLTAQALAHDIEAHASALQRRVLARAKAAAVKARARVMQAEPVRALAEACAENGPWNVVAMGTPLRPGSGASAAGASLSDLFDGVHATTGIVVAGAKARRTNGPVIAVVEEIERLVPTMRVAERIATTTGGDVRLMMLEREPSHPEDWMEGQIRLALGACPTLKLHVVDMARCTAADVAHLMRREGAGFVITRFGGRLTPDEAAIAPFAALLEGPLFLVR